MYLFGGASAASESSSSLLGGFVPREIPTDFLLSFGVAKDLWPKPKTLARSDLIFSALRWRISKGVLFVGVGRSVESGLWALICRTAVGGKGSWKVIHKKVQNL